MRKTIQHILSNIYDKMSDKKQEKYAEIMIVAIVILLGSVALSALTFAISQVIKLF